jgi:hypothetical protein
MGMRHAEDTLISPTIVEARPSFGHAELHTAAVAPGEPAALRRQIES